MDKTRDQIAKEMTASPRYPYTFAADWLRGALGISSRAEASEWLSEAADSNNITSEELACVLADQYVRHANMHTCVEKRISNTGKKFIGEP